MHWSELPKNTRVGWRGPMIPWETLDKMPKLYWGANEDYDWGLDIAHSRLSQKSLNNSISLPK
jgi:hypothetical protein